MPGPASQTMHTISVVLLLVGCIAASEATRRRSWRHGVTSMMVVAALALTFIVLAPGWEGAAELLVFLLVAGGLVAMQARLRAEHDRLARLCDIDEATSCLNRRGFAAVLASEISRALRSGSDVALIALDLDHFKQVNDRFGHLTGDEVLREVGRTLAEQVGLRGVVARMGGEEFAALLPGFDAEAAGVIAERILSEIRGRQFASLPSDVRLTLSGGISAERVTNPAVGAALRARSDEALYAAKRSGRDRVLLWAPGVHSNSTPVRSSLIVDRPGGAIRKPGSHWRTPA